MSAILAIIIAFITLFVPGELLALALLNKTKLNLIEISVIGFIFGLIAVPTLTWIESYFMFVIHFFAFSLGLFEINAVVLTIIGIILCFYDGIFSVPKIKAFISVNSIDRSLYKLTNEQVREKLVLSEEGKALVEKDKSAELKLEEEYENELSKAEDDQKAQIESNFKSKKTDLTLQHRNSEIVLLNKINKEKEGKTTGESKPFTSRIKSNWVYAVLIIIMLISFYIGMMSEVIAPVFFQFDPYFYMLSAQSIITYGYQLLYTPYAWPAVTKGVVLRAQPIIPYLSAYWYSLANYLGPHYTTFSTSLMAYASSFYPPIVGALLVFVIFMLLYREYNKYIALIGAALTATMPILVTEFTAGMQLTEPWGIFSLFFFFMAYLLAVKDMKSTRLAIFAGIAFASTFLGAHYYTVDMGILALYILIEGIIDLLMRKGISKDFYKMNIKVIAVIAVFLAIYMPYHATFSESVPKILGIPLTVAGPALALLLIAIMDYGPKLLNKYQIIFHTLDKKVYAEWIGLIIIITLIAIVTTPLGKPVIKIIELSKKFTTPSSALFMTVAQYEPSGLMFNFGLNGFGFIGSSVFGVPIMVWLVSIISIVLILAGIIYRRSETGVFYLAIAIPLMFAGFSEVEYMPHFGTAYIILFCIILGELIYLVKSKFNFKNELNININDLYHDNKDYVYAIMLFGLFFISTILGIIAAALLIFKYKHNNNTMFATLGVFLVILIIGSIATNTILLGESASWTTAFYAQALYNPSNPTANNACDSSIGDDLFCNTVPSYWISLTNWMKTNIGPYGPRVLSWWDYGDWINWFGHTDSVLRGDNANASEDYAVAASYVLGPKFGFNSTQMQNMMDGNQTAYVVFDKGIISKWGALDFLACVDINATSEAYAINAGKAVGAPYKLGTSPCEIDHDPQYSLVPLSVLEPNSTSSVNPADYCISISTSTETYAKVYFITNESLGSSHYCMSTTPNSNGAVQLYYSNGTAMNAYINLGDYVGEEPLNINGTEETYVEYENIYTPNGPNDTITNAPSYYYTSNFYKGFFLGKLKGFHQVYSYVNDTKGVNDVNYTDPIRLFELNNFTGKLPPVPVKPSFIVNNMTMP